MRKILGLALIFILIIALSGCITIIPSFGSAPSPKATSPAPNPSSTYVLPGAHAGDVAPDFTLPDLNGQPVSLSQYRGRPVFLNFWSPT